MPGTFAGRARIAAAVLAPLALAVALLAAIDPADARRSRFSCAKARGATEVQTEHARVYRVSNGDFPDELFACTFRSRSGPIGLGTDSTESAIGDITIAGRWLALTRTEGSPVGGDVEFGAVEVHDLRGRHGGFEYREGAPPDRPDAIVEFVQRVVLTRNGSIAWTMSDGRVLKSDRFGPAQLVDSGADAHSLALAARPTTGGYRVYWTLQDGTPRTTTIR